MKTVFFVFLFFSIVFLTSCRPEDGFCYKEEYSGSNNFVCSEMDEYFSRKGSEVENYYTAQVIIYRDTLVKTSDMFAGVQQTSIEKPEYIPVAMPLENMSKCTIAPKKGEMDCNEWLSFVFESIDSVSLEFSSRRGKSHSEELVMEHIKIVLPEISLKGTVNGTEILVEDTTLIEENSVEIIHRFSLFPK